VEGDADEDQSMVGGAAAVRLLPPLQLLRRSAPLQPL
jgi:hypothetical protein